MEKETLGEVRVLFEELRGTLVARLEQIEKVLPGHEHSDKLVQYNFTCSHCRVSRTLSVTKESAYTPRACPSCGGEACLTPDPNVSTMSE